MPSPRIRAYSAGSDSSRSIRLASASTSPCGTRNPVSPSRTASRRPGELLATTGVQKGHMALHSHNIAMMAGAVGDEVEALAKILVALGKVRVDVAEAELKKLRAVL